MPRTSDLYPDKFMKAHHIEELMGYEEEHIAFTIKGSDVQEYDDGKKQLMLKFRETHLELGLNKGNATALTQIFESDDSDDWVGKKVVLHTEIVRNSFAPSGQGPAIRISVKQTAKANREKPVAIAPAKGKTTAPPVTQAEVDDLDADDDIPF